MLAIIRPQSITLCDFLAPGLLRYHSPILGPRHTNNTGNVHRNASTHALHRPAARFKPHKSPQNNKLSPRSPEHEDTVALFVQLKNELAKVHKHASADQTKLTEDQVRVFNESVQGIRSALSEGKLDSVAKVWKALEGPKEKSGDGGLKRLLGISQYQSFAKRIEKLCRDVMDGGRTLSSSRAGRIALGEISVAAAADSSVYHAIRAYMTLLIRRREPEAVIELYAKFQAAVDEKSSEAENDSVSKEEDDDLIPKIDTTTININTDDTVYDPGRAEVLLATLAAFAMKDDFRGGLKMALDSPIRLSVSSTARFLQDNLSEDKDLCERITAYVGRIATARMVSRPAFITRRIGKLTNDNSVRSLTNAYNDILAGLKGPEAYIAPDPSQIGDKLVTMTEAVWSTFLFGFLKCKRPDLAEGLWDDLLSLNVKPGVAMWTSLISGYGSMGATEDAIASWKAMIAEGVTPDALTYRALINNLFVAQQDAHALEKFSEFQKTAMSSSSDEATLNVYNTVLHGLLIAVKEKEAIALLEDMKERGPAPDIVSYNTFLRFHGRRTQFKELAGYMKDMEARNISGDVFSFSTILSALLKVGRPNAAEMILELMHKQGVEPNVATYSAIIHDQMLQQDQLGLKGAFDLLEKMEHDGSAEPNDVTYTTILAGTHRGRWLTYLDKQKVRKDILQRMAKRNIRPNLVMYQILIQASLDNAEPEGLQTAMEYYKEIKARKIPMTQDTWYIILLGLINRKEWDVADSMLKEMFYSSSTPPIPRVMKL